MANPLMPRPLDQSNLDSLGQQGRPAVERRCYNPSRRVKRRLVNLLAVLSLLLSAATLALWVRSYKTEFFVSSKCGLDRYALRFERGRAALYSPPAAAQTTTTARSAAALASQIRNDQLTWFVHHNKLGFFGGDGGRTIIVAASGDRATQAIGPNHGFGATVYSAADVARPLLRALESRDAFAAAHIVLVDHFKTRDNVTISDEPGGRCFANMDGLKVWLRRSRPYVANNRSDTVMYYATAQLVPEQLPFIREQWHRRLDVRLFSVPILAMVAATLIAPAWFLFSKARQFWRRRRNRCPGCGYDLRATPERCPECGTAPEGHKDEVSTVLELHRPRTTGI
jgi:hypothetical protein